MNDIKKEKGTKKKKKPKSKTKPQKPNHPPSPHHPSMPEAGVRAGHEVIGAGELALPPPAAALGRAGLMPHLGNTVEMTLKV